MYDRKNTLRKRLWNGKSLCRMSPVGGVYVRRRLQLKLPRGNKEGYNTCNWIYLSRALVLQILTGRRRDLAFLEANSVPISHPFCRRGRFPMVNREENESDFKVSINCSKATRQKFVTVVHLHTDGYMVRGLDPVPMVVEPSGSHFIGNVSVPHLYTDS